MGAHAKRTHETGAHQEVTWALFVAPVYMAPLGAIIANDCHGRSPAALDNCQLGTARIRERAPDESGSVRLTRDPVPGACGLLEPRF